MGELPSIWRVELFHPLVVHFPIALLLSGTIAWLAGQVVDEAGTWGFLEPAGRLMLGAGVITAWIAVYTGDLANTEVARRLCDPTVVETHEDYAFLAEICRCGRHGPARNSMHEFGALMRWLDVWSIDEGAEKLSLTLQLRTRTTYSDMSGCIRRTMAGVSEY